MFQTYQDFTDPTLSEPRLIKLRHLLNEKKLDGFLVPRSDEYMNEYIPDRAARLFWLTGFSGSAGHAVILKEKAALFVDGRYTLQANAQVSIDLFEILEAPPENSAEWICKHLPSGSQLGFDPKLHTLKGVTSLRDKLAKKNIQLSPQSDNPIDAIWQERPAHPKTLITNHPLKYTGKKSSDKILKLQYKLQQDKHDALMLTSPESIAWLFNIRGQDIPHTPLPLCYALVPASSQPYIFVESEKLSASAKRTLQKISTLSPPDKLITELNRLGKQKAKVCLDSNMASFWFADILEKAGAVIIECKDPCQLEKAIKNPVEIAGARTAHLRDGTAMCRFLAWLDEHSLSGQLDEITAAKQLEQFRAETGALKEISFDTISGAGPNGAIIHYRVTERTNRKLRRNSLYLVDSGAQYLDGTTDITRTIALGKPTKEMKTRFTLVLKGHIGLATTLFPKGTTGSSLDVLARQALWSHGLDYAHGTGHGVGSYLSVHESPPSISRYAHHELKPGMIISNEPGYYKTGKYGIRIENLVLVSEPQPIKGGDQDMMSFETLTLAPIDCRLIEPDLLSDAELKWLNDYHAHVRKVISPDLQPKEKSWLREATRPFVV